MKVKEFIKLLEKVDLEQEVIMSKDAEGNGFSPFCELGFGYYVPDNEYSGELYDEEDEASGDKPHNAQKSVILWPLN
jgi:hypothetical protein